MRDFPSIFITSVDLSFDMFSIKSVFIYTQMTNLDSIFEADRKIKEVLKAVPTKGTFDVSDIAGTILYSPSEVNELISKMEENELIKKYTSSKKQDSSILYMLSEKGYDLRRKILMGEGRYT